MERELQQQKEAAAEVNNMTNTAGTAYYKDDDSISTLGSFAESTSPTTKKRLPTISKTPSQDYSYDGVTPDTQSVTSSVTMESFTQLRSDVTGIQSRFDRMEVMLESLVNSQRMQTDVSHSSKEGRKAGGQRSHSSKAS